MNKSKCNSHKHGSRNLHQEGGVAVFDEEVCIGFHVRYNNIGIKHDFSYINICWVPRVALKPEQEN